MKLGILAISAVCLALGVAPEAQALRTTYFWGGDPTGRADSLFFDCDDAPTAAHFPELCGASGAALLSVTFTHDDPIPNWDTNGCSDETPELCVVINYDTILRVVISEFATFSADEIVAFRGVDFLGSCRGPCDATPPFIAVVGMDATTGSQISGHGFGDDRGGWIIRINFADGRQYDWGGFWSHGLTVPEPGSAATLAFGLVGLVLARRRKLRTPAR
jgi:hypothetical protein